MKKINISLCCWVIFVCLFSLSGQAQNPTYLLELRNDAQTSSTVYEFDIYLLRTGSATFEYASGQFGILINPQIKTGGTMAATIVAGSSDPILVSSGQNPTSILFTDASNVIKIAGRTPPQSGNGAVISNVSPGTKICRVRLTTTLDFGQFQPNLTWTTNLVYPTQVSVYVAGINTLITNYTNHTTGNLANPVLNTVTASDDITNDDSGMRVYPNPFNDRVTIDYKLLNKTQVRLSVFDTNGKLIDQLVNNIQQAGSYSLPWFPESQTEGTYMVKLQTGMTQKISRITLIR